METIGSTGIIVGLHRGHIGTMEKSMEATIVGLGSRLRSSQEGIDTIDGQNPA